MPVSDDELWRILRASSGLAGGIDSLTRLSRTTGVGQVMLTHSMNDFAALPARKDKMTIIAICNQKGGVGKSTTTFHLARTAAITGHRVLVVDADPQGNITAVLSAEPLPENTAGVADALSTRAPDTLRDVIVASVWEGVDLAPTTGLENLAGVRDELVVAGAGRENRLRAALREVEGDYDVVLIDCPPSLDQLTINALTAADGVLIVTQSKRWSSDGLQALLRTITSVQDYYNRDLAIAGIIVNMHESRTIAGTRWLDQLHQAAQAAKLTVLEPPVPKKVIIQDAAEASMGLDQYPGDTEDLEATYTGYLDALLNERVMNR